MKIKYLMLFMILLVLGISCGTGGIGANYSPNIGNVKPWDEETEYPSGYYVSYGGYVYRAVSSSKEANPRLKNASSIKKLDPWSKTSLEEMKSRGQQLGVKFVENNPIFNFTPLTSDIPTWEKSPVYNGSDLVISDGKYYKNIWWNHNQDPAVDENKNNHKVGNNTYWGPWVEVTREQALVLLKEQQDSMLDNNPNPNTDADTDGGSDNVSPDNVSEFAWSSIAVYLENDLATLGGKFYRSKWWNQNNNPSTPVVNEWDSPWQEITESAFAKLLEGGGVTPPDEKPDPDTNPNPNPNPDPNNPNPQYTDITARGYIQEWNWSELPQSLKDAFNDGALQNGNIFAVQNGAQAIAAFGIKNEPQWNQLFPRRRGSDGWRLEAANQSKYPGDYYSYENFKAAMNIIGEYAYVIVKALDPSTGQETFFERNYILHKPSGKVRLISQSDDYFAANNDWLLNRPVKYKVVDYAAFGSEGSVNDKKRVVAGFLAHASHETSGSWNAAPDWAFNKNLFPGAIFPNFITGRLPGELAWSLYYNEELAYTNGGIGYIAAENKIFPPTSGKSYHGRGAFQLSWNYNYGLASAIFFGDSSILLDNPDMITDGGTVASNPNGNTWRKGTHIEGGTMAFLTSLMFWLTPQGAKPSQQDTMILNTSDGRYTSAAKLRADSGRGTPGYGWTINIMNGGFEANKSWEKENDKYDVKVARRVKHYIFFTQALGGNNSGEVLDTLGKHSY